MWSFSLVTDVYCWHYSFVLSWYTCEMFWIPIKLHQKFLPEPCVPHHLLTRHCLYGSCGQFVDANCLLSFRSHCIISEGQSITRLSSCLVQLILMLIWLVRYRCSSSCYCVNLVDLLESWKTKSKTLFIDQVKLSAVLWLVVMKLIGLALRSNMGCGSLHLLLFIAPRVLSMK